MESNYSSALTISSPLYVRPGNPWDNVFFFYKAIQIRVGIPGTYSISSKSTINTHGYIYNNTFNSSFPGEHLLQEDEDAGDNEQFMLTMILTPFMNYILVVTTYWATTIGEFAIIATGPGPITCSSINVSHMESNYSSALTISSPLYVRPGNPWINHVFFYNAIQIRVGIPGIYSIISKSTMDTHGYIYNNTFNSSFPGEHLLQEDEDAGDNEQFMLTMILTPFMNYILVVTTYWATTIGEYSIIATGPGPITCSSINVSYMESNYSSALTISSPLYVRPGNPWDNVFFFYKAIQIRVGIPGIYSIISKSTMDTHGYIYNNTFNSSFPGEHLLQEDEDAGDNEQFMLTMILTPFMNYILVVTTYWASTIGEFAIIAAGPGPISFLPVNSTNVQSKYSTALTQSSAKFRHSLGDTQRSNYYYQAIRISVSMSSVYTISCNSTFDTIGYLYNNTFNVIYPSANLIIADDESGGNSQFMFIIMLNSLLNYTLVVTTYEQNIIGSFTIVIVGAGVVNIVGL
ncbi:hypothetical protein I4U23_022135 [Adineta vaga]|nr:hypothetical protein I4U23_022135 [Adineta vaga]